MANTLWTGDATTEKIYVQSGQFTSAVKDSADISGVSSGRVGGASGSESGDFYWISWFTDKLYIQSGQVTTTVKDSLSVAAANPFDVSADDSNSKTGYTENTAGKLTWLQGFTSTVDSSASVEAVDNNQLGFSWDGTNTLWTGNEHTPDKMYLQSGQVTTTVKTSLAHGQGGNNSISYTGIDTLLSRTVGADKLYLYSGQFTSTIKDSQDINSVNTNPFGISTDDYASRVPGGVATLVQDLICAGIIPFAR